MNKKNNTHTLKVIFVELLDFSIGVGICTRDRQLQRPAKRVSKSGLKWSSSWSWNGVISLKKRNRFRAKLESTGVYKIERGFGAELEWYITGAGHLWCARWDML